MNNLPIPQSRIEVLMNAFISRDSSQISAPQSRIEEFWYHLIEGTNALPIPQSRIELLLKKIIENDTKQIPLAKSRAEEFLVSILTGDINKLPIPQSRSEYYLDYIARNNLVLDDIEYVKYSGTNITASNTVQKPFRSAILKGNTLVNIFDVALPTEIKNNHNITISYRVGANETYTFIVEAESTSEKYQGGFITTDGRGNGWNVSVDNGISKFTVTTKEETNKVRFSAHGASNTVQIKKCMIIKGDYSNQDIPFFTGMQSVKLPVLTTSNEDGTKTNILTVNEPIELRGIGDVQDELNLMTGEITQNIAEAVLSTFGSYAASTSKGIYYMAKTKVANDISPSHTLIFGTNKFILKIYSERGENFEIRVSSKEDGTYPTRAELSEYLSQNPLTLCYIPTTSTVKTVDLSILDQNENKVSSISSFNDTTHITASSETIPPIFEGYLATKEVE